MNLSKAEWTTDGDKFALSMPITKVDKERRLVSGWATLDNPDRQGDIVLADASRAAFSRFRGNIREMHQKVAVGKMIDFQEDQYYDPDTETFYNGIIVTAYVSKGAESTWEKVLDGTLQGFSISGPLHSSEPVIKKNVDGTLARFRIVKDYDITELSLVDSPANQLANLVSIVKVDDGSILKGMIVDTRSENVFWCETDELAKTSSNDSVDCASCGTTMTNVGWFEYDSSEPTVEKVRSVLDTYLNKREGGNDMPVKETEEVVEKAADVSETAEEVVEKSDEATEEVEKAAEVSEVEDTGAELSEDVLSKLRDDIVSAVTEQLGDAFAAKLAEATEALTKSIAGIAENGKELTEKFDKLSGDMGTLEKRIEGTEAEFGLKKSGDLGGDPEDALEKSDNSTFWGGNFLTSETL